VIAVAAEYKTNHHFVRRGSSPEVKMSESKVRLQMVNVKYNYFSLHALLPKNLGVTLPWPSPIFRKILRGHVQTVPGNITCLPNLKSVALNVFVLDSGHQLQYKIDGPKFADPRLTDVSP